MSGKREPVRLDNNRYMELESSFKIYRHRYYTSTDVHWHEFYELGFVISGQGKHYLNGKEYPVRRGNIFLLTPIDIHEIVPATEAPVEIYNVIFKENMLHEQIFNLLFLARFEDSKDIVFDLSGDELLDTEREFARLWKEFNQEQIGTKVAICSTLNRILLDLARHILKDAGQAEPFKPSSKQAAIMKALVYIQHHFREPLTLQDMSRITNFAPNYFSACFHEMTGKTFQSFLQDIRLTFAMSLLTASDLAITDICYSSGYNTVTHFNRAFKQKYVLSPTEYRKKVKRLHGATGGLSTGT